MPEHLHTIPVDSTLTADEAWRELRLEERHFVMGGGKPMTASSTFQDFARELGWSEGVTVKALRIARLRMMRGLPKWTEDDWRHWAEGECDDAECA